MEHQTFFQKGIILAGGAGTRLDPITRQVSKQLLPVFDKPMIYYPLTTLMLAGIRSFFLISSPQHLSSYQQLLGDGSALGISIQYAAQPRPEGIAQSLIIADPFIAGDHVALILGDNIFYGQGLQAKLAMATARREGATVFRYAVNDPQRYGIIELDEAGQPRAILEKPSHTRSRYAVTGVYFYDGQAVELTRQINPSDRGELEITDLNRLYLEQSQLHVESFGRGFAWLDTGTEVSLLQAANFVETVQQRQGLRIACVEEVAYRMKFITLDDLAELAAPIRSSYGDYLREIVTAESEPDG